MTKNPNQSELNSDSVKSVNIMNDKKSLKMYFNNYPEVAIPVLVIGICFISFLMYYVWRSVRNYRHKKSQLAALTSKPSSSHLYSGVKASQTIEFVVPTITLKCTEPSFSVTEESDSDCLMQFPYNPLNRKRNSNIQINENEISKSLYEELPAKPEDRPEINFVLHYSFVRQQLLVVRV